MGAPMSECPLGRPSFAMTWPRPPAALSDKDCYARDFDLNLHASGY